MATPFIDTYSYQVCATNTVKLFGVTRVATQAFKTSANYLGLLYRFKFVKAQELQQWLRCLGNVHARMPISSHNLKYTESGNEKPARISDGCVQEGATQPKSLVSSGLIEGEENCHSRASTYNRGDGEESKITNLIFLEFFLLFVCYVLNYLVGIITLRTNLF